MPFSADAKALEGLSTTAQSIAEIVDAELTTTRVLGCVQIGHDTRLAVSCDARDQVAAAWGPLIFDTALRVNPFKAPGMGVWGLKFLRECTDERFRANAAQLVRLGGWRLRNQYPRNKQQKNQRPHVLPFRTGIFTEPNLPSP
jgi:hypothetical protein